MGLTGRVHRLMRDTGLLEPGGVYHCGQSCHLHGLKTKSGGGGCRETAMLPAAQLSQEAGSLKGSMATGLGGLGWAWSRVRVSDRAKLRTELVTRILFNIFGLVEGETPGPGGPLATTL